MSHRADSLAAPGRPPAQARALQAAALVLASAAAVLAVYALGGSAGGTGTDQGTDELVARIERTLHAPPASSTADLYAQLASQLQRQPSDVRALVLKARLDMQEQRFELAAAGYEKALGVGASKAARDPDVWVEYAEAVGMVQGRTLAGKPLQLVHQALALDPRHVPALDLAGSAAWEARDFAAATGYWQRLLEQLPAGSQRHAELSAAIQEAQRRAKLSLPPPRR